MHGRRVFRIRYSLFYRLLKAKVSFSIRLAAFQASGGTCMKFHSIRQDLQDYQDFFCIVWLYPVHPGGSVRKIKYRSKNDDRIRFCVLGFLGALNTGLCAQTLKPCDQFPQLSGQDWRLVAAMRKPLSQPLLQCCWLRFC